MPMTTMATGHDAGSQVPSLRFLAALLLAAAFVQACATGGGGSSESAAILALVPADSENVVVYDLDQIRREEAPRAPRALRDEFEDLSEYGLEEMGVLTDELTTLVVASGDDWHLLVVEGDIDFLHVRDQLEDGDYDDDQYRGSELWEGAAWRHESVALFEDRGRMVIGDAEAVKRVLRMLDSGSGSLLDDADSDLGRALKRAGEGWISSAQEECLGYEIRGCRAAGVSLRRGDSDYLVEITIAALFRNERTAESEMDELESQLEEDSSFEFDIDDVELDGDFVIVTASADEDDLFEDEDDLSEGVAPVPVAPRPTVTAIRDAPDTRAPDTRDDHGDSADEATFATVGDAVTGMVGHGRDVDYFAFAAERGQTYRIDVDLGTLDDSVAALYDSDSRQLDFDDDGGESFGSRISWTAAESGTHYVAVAGWASATGSYTLTVTAMGDAPDTRAPDTGEVTDARASGADTPPEAPSAQRIDFEASTPAGYTAVTLRTGGSVWGVPSRYTTDSNAGVVTYVLLGTVKGCEFAGAEAERGSRIYIKTQDLGRLTNFTSERVCQKRTSSWSSWGGRQITHLRFFDESEPTSVGEYVYDAAHGRYVRADGATNAQPATPSGSPPEPPANQRFEYDGAAVVLSWDASSGAGSYTVYYDDFFDSNCRLGSRGPSFCEELATNLSGASYTHVRPDPDEHYYWVVACNRFGCSAIDSTNPAQLGGSPPDAPANQRYEYDGAAIVLTWGATSDADSYTVYYDDFSGSSCSLYFGGPSFCDELATDLTVTTFTHADPDARDNYYWVVACNRFGCSEIDSANPARVAP